MSRSRTEAVPNLLGFQLTLFPKQIWTGNPKKQVPPCQLSAGPPQSSCACSTSPEAGPPAGATGSAPQLQGHQACTPTVGPLRRPLALACTSSWTTRQSLPPLPPRPQQGLPRQGPTSCIPSEGPVPGLGGTSVKCLLDDCWCESMFTVNPEAR